MIKFIATDLDGTLLTDKKQLPPHIFELIRAIDERGILFAPASGRQYANLRELFAPVEDKLLFICENGALVKYRGQTLHMTPIRDGYLKQALDEVRSLPHLYPMLCGEATAYIENGDEPFCSYSMSAYTSCKRVPSLDGVIGRENICKIAVFDETASAERCIKTLQARLPNLRITQSGQDWCDVTAPEVNKGVAIRVIRDIFGLAREECMAFGDHMNDYEMLLECGTAYVTENAFPPLKALIGGVIPSNDEGGVVKKLQELLNER